MPLTAKNAYVLEWWINGCPAIDYDYNPHPTHKATKTQRAVLFSAARGRCEICLAHDRGVHGHVKLVVDHDHYRGSLRGMLCTRCNLIVERTRTPAGLRGEAHQDRYEDGPNPYKAALLRRAASYLERQDERRWGSLGLMIPLPPA
jgi:hypothetical protein